jgi:hypothetical protein
MRHHLKNKVKHKGLGALFAWLNEYLSTTKKKKKKRSHTSSSFCSFAVVILEMGSYELFAQAISTSK